MKSKIVFVTESDPIISSHIAYMLESLHFNVTVTNVDDLRNYFYEIQETTTFVISIDYINKESILEMTNKIQNVYHSKILLISTLGEKCSYNNLPYLDKPFTPYQLLDLIGR